MPYLVDGNNLAHALGLADGSRARRNECARLVLAFCRQRGASATIVFDGPTGSDAGASEPRLRVLFSGAQSADALILSLLNRGAAAADFTVVTSDKSLGDRARHRGASLMRCHEFARRLKEVSSERPHPESSKDRAPSASEVEAWLRVFEGRKPAKR